MKRSAEEAFEEDCDSYLKIKEAKTVKIRCALTNIISNNRAKLRELFTGELMHEILPFETYIIPDDLKTLKSMYTDVLDCYDKIEDLQSFNRFEVAYENVINFIFKLFPLRDNGYLEINRINIPLPFGLFYAVITKLRDVYNAGSITWPEFAACRDYALRTGKNASKYSLMSKHMNYMYYDDMVSPTDPKYNDLDVKYLDIIPTFIQTYGWWTPKVVYMYNAGLSLQVDRYKIHVKLGELVSEDNYQSEDMLELN